MIWHLYNGYSVHIFPRLCWFRDYSNSILIKLYLIWVYLVICLVWSVESCFGKCVATCAEKAFLLMSLPGEMARGGFSRWSSAGWVQISINLNWKERHERSVAKSCWVMLAQETPCLGYLPFITNFLPSHSTGFPLFPPQKISNHDISNPLLCISIR